eukprot:TRINITY_DN564_c0_g2_i1.p1 TRINITY_DN564_c0_g2~~TRINITY_DN564_c0_g2_i1.p1  ORF type:complete len:410 (-),score=115.91 TRINITY_DN564_c0_g2_i1:186-1415(-)
MAAGKTMKATSMKKKKVATKKDGQLKKVRIGILVGKDFDPVKKNTQWPDYPKKYTLTNDDWGKYSVDVATALRMQQLHPDLLEIDIIPGKEITQQRLKKNHVNLNFWYDVGVAILNGGKKHIDEVMKCHKNPECRLDPSWDYYDWVLCKPRYMDQLKKAGIPTIPTVAYRNGFDPKQCMKDVKKMGWDKFFCKVGHFTFFGAGAINGKTEDFLGKRAKDLEKYAEENKNSKVFLLQPYTLKPNGEVFDEVRNFFIDGQWRYSVFTHGTDETDAGYYEEPEGPRKAACKALAERAYQEVLKASTWQGKKQTPLLNRIDIGVVPKKGGDSLNKTDNTYFVNEIELIMTTWLDRYSPISVQDNMAQASIKHSLELLVGLLNAKKVPDHANVKKVVNILNQRLGPFKHLKLKA